MTVYKVPLKKVKGHFVEVDSAKEKISPELFAYIFAIGLKAIVNRGVTDLKVENFPNVEAYNAEAIRIGEAQVAAIYAGKTRMVGAAKTAGAKKGPEHTEAMRLARIWTKEQIRARGEKISHYSAASISEAAAAYIAADPDTWYTSARESLNRAAVKPTKGTDIHLEADPKLVAKAKAAAEKKKAEAKAKAEGKTAQAAPPPKKAPGKKPGARPQA